MLLAFEHALLRAVKRMEQVNERGVLTSIRVRLFEILDRSRCEYGDLILLRRVALSNLIQQNLTAKRIRWSSTGVRQLTLEVDTVSRQVA